MPVVLSILALLLSARKQKTRLNKKREFVRLILVTPSMKCISQNSQFRKATLLMNCQKVKQWLYLKTRQNFYSM